MISNHHPPYSFLLHLGKISAREQLLIFETLTCMFHVKFQQSWSWIPQVATECTDVPWNPVPQLLPVLSLALPVYLFSGQRFSCSLQMSGIRKIRVCLLAYDIRIYFYTNWLLPPLIFAPFFSF